MCKLFPFSLFLSTITKTRAPPLSCWLNGILSTWSLFAKFQPVDLWSTVLQGFNCKLLHSVSPGVVQTIWWIMLLSTLKSSEGVSQQPKNNFQLLLRHGDCRACHHVPQFFLHLALQAIKLTATAIRHSFFKFMACSSSFSTCRK